MWHASFRSGVATLRTAIHLLRTYLLTRVRLVECGHNRTPVASYNRAETLHISGAARGGKGEAPPLWVDVQKLCNMCVLSLS